MRSSILAIFAGLAAVAMASSALDEDLSMEEMIARGIVNEERDDSNEEWMDLNSFGVLLERSPVPGTSLTAAVEERSVPAPERQELLLERDSLGGLKFPRNWDEGQEMAKRGLGHIKREGMSKLAKRGFLTAITWYSGHDLLGPACVTHSRWHPTDNSLACAMAIKQRGAGGLKCGQYIKIKSANGRKSVTCRLVDLCAGCGNLKTQHIDLTKKAFKTIANLNQGKLYNLKAAIVSSPPGGWNPAYGPKQL